MAQAGDEYGGPGGFRLRLVRTAADTGGELLEMEVAYGGEGGFPPEHVHPRQEERFEVLEGAMRTVVDGAERRYEAGETLEVPRGTPHTMAADGPTRTRWEVRPALRTAEFFERVYGGGSGPHPATALEEFLAEFSEEIRFTGG